MIKTVNQLVAPFQLVITQYMMDDRKEILAVSVDTLA